MPNISDKLREFFGDPTIPGQAVEEVLMNAKAMGYGPGSGGGSGLLVTQISYNSGVYTLDKTWQEIIDALRQGAVIAVDDRGAHEVKTQLIYFASVNIVPSPDPTPVYSYYVQGVDFEGDTVYYYADSANGYPAFDDN